MVLSDEEIEKIKSTTQVKVACNIRRIRELKKMTQIELAHRINSDRQYLYKIETSKVGLSIGKLAVIARALDVNLSELLD